MPTYQITAPNGKTLEVTGDRLPTEAELHDIFAKAGVDTAPAAAAPAASPVHLAPSMGGTVGGIVGGVSGATIGQPTAGAALGAAAGEGYEQALRHARELPGAIVDVAHGLVEHPRETLTGFVQGAATGAANAGVQAAEQAALVKGTAMAASAVGKVLPSASRAGETLQQVMGKAKDVPLDLSEPGNVALRIKDLADRGGTLPKAVNDFLKYAADPKKADMTYEVGRDFASNISRLSADEMQRLTPIMKWQVGELRVALNKSLVDAAAQVGQGEAYKAALKEYAQAMAFREHAKAVAKLALAGGLGAAAYQIVKNELGSIVGGLIP